MTPQEALNTLDKTVIRNLELKIVLSNALEKQIPKKPIIHGVRDRDINTISYTCPICNKHIWITEVYCNHCGQALDWSEEK